MDFNYCELLVSSIRGCISARGIEACGGAESTGSRDLRAHRVPKKKWKSGKWDDTYTRTNAHTGTGREYIARKRYYIRKYCIENMQSRERSRKIEVGRTGRYPGRARVCARARERENALFMNLYTHFPVYCPSIFRTLSNSSDFAISRSDARVPSLHRLYFAKGYYYHYFRATTFQNGKFAARARVSNANRVVYIRVLRILR